jgi:hypothetical protein
LRWLLFQPPRIITSDAIFRAILTSASLFPKNVEVHPPNDSSIRIPYLYSQTLNVADIDMTDIPLPKAKAPADPAGETLSVANVDMTNAKGPKAKDSADSAEKPSSSGKKRFEVKKASRYCWVIISNFVVKAS